MMIIRILCFILICKILFFCTFNEPTEDNFKKEVQSILSRLNIKPDTTSIYVFIPGNICLGCRQHAFQHIIQKVKERKVVFITSDLSYQQLNEKNARVVIDKTKCIDRSLYFKEKISIYVPLQTSDTIVQFNPFNIDSIPWYLQQKYRWLKE